VGKEGGLSKTIDQVLEIMTKINQGKGTVGLLVNDPKLYKETTQAVTAAAKFLTDLGEAKGALGTLINDPKFKAQLEQTLTAVQTTFANLSQGSADFKEAAVRLPEISKKLDELLTYLNKAGKGLPGLVTSGETMVNDADKAAKAAQKTWLLRRHVPQPQEHTIRLDGEAEKK
jgi:phospholipid/cholesterol/gamma-HCH transport system substrate-binding protein